MPSDLNRSIVAKISSVIRGARPVDGSSSIRSLGSGHQRAPTATICCSPPESVPASWRRRSRNFGNSV